MTRRSTLLAIAVLFLAAAAYAGAPLKGVDVKLGKNPGGGAAARATTDANGNANLGVVPAGSYQLTLSLPNDTGEAEVSIRGAVGGPVTKRWSFKEGKAYDMNATARAAAQPYISITTDGKQPVMTTIIKSKSNITNN
jgi:hypothetical protein